MSLSGAAPVPLLPVIYEPLLRRALDEDLGSAGDLTTDALIDPVARARARIVARKAGRVAGIEIALDVFRMLDASIEARTVAGDGTDVEAGTALVELEGRARTLLTGERTALNFLGRLSGIATATRAAVLAVGAERPRIACTRKTTPGLRTLEKYAVRVGGGTNHRFGLDDGVLIKDNHLEAVGGLKAVIGRARARLGHMVKIEVEVDTLAQLREVVTLDVDAVLLDNMDAATLREAVGIADGRLLTEASGGITLANIAEIAASGVALISLGWLTHSVPSLDIGLDFERL